MTHRFVLVFSFCFTVASSFAQIHIGVKLLPDQEYQLHCEYENKVDYKNENKKDYHEKTSADCSFRFHQEKDGYRSTCQYNRLTQDKYLKEDSIVVTDTKSPQNFYARILKNIIGRDINGAIDKNGLVSDGFGDFDQLGDSLFVSVIQKMSDNKRKIFSNHFKEMYGKNFLNGEIESFLSAQKDTTIAPNGKWRRVSKYKCNLKGDFQTDYELINTDGKTIEVKGVTKLTDKTQPIRYSINGAGVALYNAIGTLTEDFVIDIRSGWIVNGSTKADITADMKYLNIKTGEESKGPSQKINIEVLKKVQGVQKQQ